MNRYPQYGEVDFEDYRESAIEVLQTRNQLVENTKIANPTFIGEIKALAKERDRNSFTNEVVNIENKYGNDDIKMMTIAVLKYSRAYWN